MEKDSLFLITYGQEKIVVSSPSILEATTVWMESVQAERKAAGKKVVFDPEGYTVEKVNGLNISANK